MLFCIISDLCKKRGISISRLEKECGIGNGTIGGWKTSSPRLDTLKKVADYLGTPLEILLEEEETENAKTKTQSK